MRQRRHVPPHRLLAGAVPEQLAHGVTREATAGLELAVARGHCCVAAFGMPPPVLSQNSLHLVRPVHHRASSKVGTHAADRFGGLLQD